MVDPLKSQHAGDEDSSCAGGHRDRVRPVEDSGSYLMGDPTGTDGGPVEVWVDRRLLSVVDGVRSEWLRVVLPSTILLSLPMLP